MISLKSLDDIYFIVDVYEMTDEDVKACMDKLTLYLDDVSSAMSVLEVEISNLNKHRVEARQYSEDCKLLCEELASYDKYNAMLKVAVEYLAWECALAANLAKELGAQWDELYKLVWLASDHCDVVRSYRNLLQEYLGLGPYKDDDDDDTTDDDED